MEQINEVVIAENTDDIPVYTLSVSADSGSMITVNRTSSVYADTGEISDGAPLYHGDTLKIFFRAVNDFSLSDCTVNGVKFTSGNTHTVFCDVTVQASSVQYKSKIGATDADIGNTSTITVVKYNSSFTHTITYQFGEDTGVICDKSADTSVVWNIPVSFYSQIPKASKGTCRLNIETFSGDKSLGVDECSIICSVPSTGAEPDVTVEVLDASAETASLTGDNTVFIKGKSAVRVIVKAAPKYSATITGITIDGEMFPQTSAGEITQDKVLWNCEKNSVYIQVVDSRGNVVRKTVPLTMIDYFPVTINPSIKRLVESPHEFVMAFSGNFYCGSLGSVLNCLNIRYRYKEGEPGTYGDWQNIPDTKYTISARSFQTVTEISLGGGFNSQNAYTFQIQAYDGSNDVILSQMTKTVSVVGGKPVFDWGKNDFTFNVPVRIGNTMLTEELLQRLLALLE